MTDEDLNAAFNGVYYQLLDQCVLKSNYRNRSLIRRESGSYGMSVIQRMIYRVSCLLQDCFCVSIGRFLPIPSQSTKAGNCDGFHLCLFRLQNLILMKNNTHIWT